MPSGKPRWDSGCASTDQQGGEGWLKLTLLYRLRDRISASRLAADIVPDVGKASWVFLFGR